MLKKPKRLWLGLTVSLLAVLILACGSSDAASEKYTSANTPVDDDPVQILQPEGVFSVDDVVAAGWKNSKERSPETLPDSIGAWYGFFVQRDVEVRQYETHQAALASGVGTYWSR